MDEVTGLDFTFQLAVLYNVNEKLFATYYSNGHIFIWIQRLQYSYSAWLLHFFFLIYREKQILSFLPFSLQRNGDWTLSS